MYALLTVSNLYGFNILKMLNVECRWVDRRTLNQSTLEDFSKTILLAVNAVFACVYWFVVDLQWCFWVFFFFAFFVFFYDRFSHFMLFATANRNSIVFKLFLEFFFSIDVLYRNGSSFFRSVNSWMNGAQTEKRMHSSKSNHRAFICFENNSIMKSKLNRIMTNQ